MIDKPTKNQKNKDALLEKPKDIKEETSSEQKSPIKPKRLIDIAKDSIYDVN